MQFDPENPIVKICVEGMDMEGRGQPDNARLLFMKAWNDAETIVEKITAAHFVARHQNSVIDKLKWDETALDLAKTTDDTAIKMLFPSLHLNVGKCYEDLKDYEQAHTHYELALSFSNQLLDDGYGNMIKGGIRMGIERLSKI
jgi:tetratricopeptide (TPR) repeat protein